jgi:hypothetical protein
MAMVHVNRSKYHRSMGIRASTCQLLCLMVWRHRIEAQRQVDREGLRTPTKLTATKKWEVRRNQKKEKNDVNERGRVRTKAAQIRIYPSIQDQNIVHLTITSRLATTPLKRRLTATRRMMCNEQGRVITKEQLHIMVACIDQDLSLFIRIKTSKLIKFIIHLTIHIHCPTISSNSIVQPSLSFAHHEDLYLLFHSILPRIDH